MMKMKLIATRRFSRIVAFFFAVLVTVSNISGQDDPRIKTLRGQTMGTTYTVKIFGAPSFEHPVELLVDAELRRVNDEMSTYLKSSEISRFNASESTEWFPVSESFAQVVETSLEVSRKTDGAFDISIAPLVDAWNFGAGSPNEEPKIPDAAKLAALADSIGYQNLAVRLNPPAIRKSISELQIDLSAIAKGHGVDRVVDRLHRAGAEDVFVEIGGEVRTSGDKSGEWWKVGIQLPDAAKDTVMIAHSMTPDSKQAMATSGDYRNNFEADGVRYSHTIDPRTLRPITHGLASVTVVAESCMEADAWATAINVLGPDKGLRIAESEKIDALLISRANDGYALSGTGTLQQYVAAPDDTNVEAKSSGFLPVMLLTTVFLSVVLVAMAIGVIFGRKSIAGSCGGLANERNEDGSVSCSVCSNPDNACRELKKRIMQTSD